MAVEEMDSERARQRCEQGGAILCLDVPEGTEMRCDLTSWMAGHAFKGIKMIPPGLHIITVIAVATCSTELAFSAHHMLPFDRLW